MFILYPFIYSFEYMSRLLVFHPTIAPYRIDFFNDLAHSFQTRICLRYWNLRDQTFEYEKIYSRFLFKPVYLKELFKFWGRSFEAGYWKNLDEFQPDIVLTEEFGMGTMLVLLHRFFKRKKYKVITLCDDSYDMVAEKNEFSALHRWARKWMAPCLDDIIVIEPRTRNWYECKYGKGYFFPIIKREESARMDYLSVLDWSREIRRKCSLENKRIFLFVGRLVALKNVSSIIRSFAALDQKGNKLVIVGEGPEKEHLKLLAEELQINVLFTGRLEGDALNVWYDLADTLILASTQEAFGAVTNEALLAGCHVLVSNRAGSACLVEEGVNGYTFNPLNVKELSEKMKKVLCLPVNYDADGMKKNLMFLSYQVCMRQLVNYLKRLAHG